MTKRQPPRAVREPVPEYFDARDRRNPALSFLESTASAAPPDLPPDVATRHDEYLADWAMASWTETTIAWKARPRRT